MKSSSDSFPIVGFDRPFYNLKLFQTFDFASNNDFPPDILKKKEEEKTFTIMYKNFIMLHFATI
jgi:hypothetical protein